MLSRRQKKIIECILKQPEGINGSKISEIVKVSSRTIRNDIVNINMFLMNNHCMINSSKKAGYFIVSENLERIKECLTVMEAINAKSVAATPQERKYYLLGKLMNEGECALFEIADQLYVSEQTIYKDIIGFVKTLELKFGFSTIKMDNSMIQLIASEREIRSLFYRIVKEEISLSNKFIDLHLYQLVKDQVDIDEINAIADYISNFCNSYSIVLPDQILFIIAWMVFYTSLRVDHGFVLETWTRDHINEIDERIAQLLDRTSHDLHLDFDEKDKYLLEEYISTLGLFSNREENVVSNDTERITKEFIAQIKEKYSIDFESMPALLANFKIHLEFAIKRLKMDYQLANPLRDEVKIKYAFAYEISMLIVPVVYDQYHLYMIEDEISFLALYIQPFLQMQNTSSDIMIVYGSAVGYAHLIETWLNQEFKGRIHVVGYSSLYQLEDKLNHTHVDLLISTVALDRCYQVPVLNIFNLPTSADSMLVDKTISKLVVTSQSNHVFDQVFNEKFVHFYDSVNDLEEVVRDCANQFYECDIIEDSEAFVQNTLSRESVYPTHIANGCFMPHPLMNMAKSMCIQVVVIRNPNRKDENAMRLLFVSALEPKLVPELKLVYNLINYIAVTPSLIQVLCELKNERELVHYLAHIVQMM